MYGSTRGWDLKQSLQASGEVKEARVIAVTYLGGKMFAHVPSVLFSDALGHEIVPLSTLASPKPESNAHPYSQARWPFRMCCSVRQGLLFAAIRLCECLFVCLSKCVRVCVGMGGSGGWAGVGCQLALSSPLLSDWQSERSSAAMITGCTEDCHMWQDEHLAFHVRKKGNQSRENQGS